MSKIQNNLTEELKERKINSLVRKSTFVFTIYFLIIICFMWFGFGIDTTIDIFLIFTFVPVAILVLILITGVFVKIKKSQNQNPYLTPSALTERNQNPEEWMRKRMNEIESGTIRENPFSPVSKSTLFMRKAVVISTLNIIPSTILISIINTYIFSQLIPSTYKFYFWVGFSIMSFVFVLIAYVIADRIEKRSISSQNEVNIQQGFEVSKTNIHKSLNRGSIMLSIIVLTLVYLYLTSPKEVLEYLFIPNSPIFILLLIVGILSFFLIIRSFILRETPQR